ncbi:MAG: NADH-quinone oxidoreductase subunit H [Deltaproteobacteria bacterium]|jgi:formate hydrogenlyase subunit 4|nr:NADH-quinone oxidoreductase subunit H [Deltaproteobacteria bacterium]
MTASPLPVLLGLVFAPLLAGVINRIKAWYAGRKGRPLLQLYFDLFKLLQKGEVLSRTTTWVFAIGPSIYLATTIGALLFVPFVSARAPLSFAGDFVLMAYLMGFGRFALILAALDTGSPFEGMGASREAAFSALAEPVIFLCFLALGSGVLSSLHAFCQAAREQIWTFARPELLLIPVALFALLLVENCRIPVDDPNTHLELTMIHEVMILDHSGPNLAFILYASSLKLWLFALLLVDVLAPEFFGDARANWVLALAGVFATAALVGVVESCMARLRLPVVPQMLGMAGVLAALTLFMTLFR